MSGQLVGRWRVINRAENAGTNTRWNCICSCGTESAVFAAWLRSGRSKSCGCYDLDRKTTVKPGYKKGDLTVKSIADRINGLHSVTLLCVCGKRITRSAQWVRSRDASLLNCGSLAHSINHGFVFRGYPKEFSPSLNDRAGEIFKEAISKLSSDPRLKVSIVEDVVIATLDRASFCIAWREEQGFPVADRERYFRSIVRSATAQVYSKRIADPLARFSPKIDAIKEGGNMTLDMFRNPEAKTQTQGDSFIAKPKSKFKRC